MANAVTFQNIDLPSWGTCISNIQQTMDNIQHNVPIVILIVIIGSVVDIFPYTQINF
jgi:hypothetical protein